MKSAGRALLAVLALAGCLRSAPAGRVGWKTAALEPGAARESVREALGAPWVESRYWGVEVYRSPARDLALVSYDAEGRMLARVTAGWRPGWLFGAGGGWPALRSGSLSLVSDPLARDHPLLLADAQRLPPYLELRRRALACTLLLACEAGKACPDRVWIDGGAPIDPRPVEVRCADPDACPPGEPVGTQGVRVPLLHALGLKPGLHVLRLTRAGHRGTGEARFVCRAGDVMNAQVRYRIEGDSWWSRGTLAARVAFPKEFPAAWSGNALALQRAGRWLVEPEPEPDAR